MNLKYKILSKDIYKLVKKEEYWDDKDLDLVDKIAKMIKDEVARVKRAEIYLAKKQETVIEEKQETEESVTEIPVITKDESKKIIDTSELLSKISLQKEENEENEESKQVPLDGTTFLDRIFDEKVLLKEDLVKKPAKKQEEIEKLPGEFSRFIVHIETYEDFNQDTNFQKFIVSRMNKKDFMTDEVVSTLTTYIAVIDDIDEREIKRKILPLVDGIHLIKCIPVASTYILPQFANVWNHKTLI